MKRIIILGGCIMNKITKTIKMEQYWNQVNHALDKMEEHKYDEEEYLYWEGQYKEAMNLYLIVKNS